MRSDGAMVLVAVGAVGTSCVYWYLWHRERHSPAKDSPGSPGSGCVRFAPPDRAAEASTFDAEAAMRRAIQLSQAAVDHGNHPFGAVLVDRVSGAVIVEAENTAMTTSDCTRHAELNLVGFACREGIDFSGTVLVTSTEPCAMCAASMYWAGCREVVFGASESTLNTIVLDIDPAGPALPLPCRELFGRGKTWQGEFNVVGPLLETEAAAVHMAFWPKFLAQFASVHG